MDVAIAGGHGQIARRLASLLAARGDRVRGLIRNPNHAAAVHAAGAEPVVCDLEHSGAGAIAEAIEGVDAVVFAAGAGPGSGTARKLTMDRDGAVKLLDAARAVGTTRYVIISSVGAESPPSGDDPFSVYLQAKAAADAAVAGSDRDWTIVRPGRLTDEPGAGRVRVQVEPFRGEVPRDDVAAVLAAVLPEPRAFGATLYVNSGDDPVAAALEAAL
ncbi:MAG: SDR family oxidoreductase [Actinobacteria bacterium]|nr:MAG: SDR family oxidoreductase [Actinomycetota bacterium]